jgi:hypothetical protein
MQVGLVFCGLAVSCASWDLVLVEVKCVRLGSARSWRAQELRLSRGYQALLAPHTTNSTQLRYSQSSPSLRPVVVRKSHTGKHNQTTNRTAPPRPLPHHPHHNRTMPNSLVLCHHSTTTLARLSHPEKSRWVFNFRGRALLSKPHKTVSPLFTLLLQSLRMMEGKKELRRIIYRRLLTPFSSALSLWSEGK